MIYDIHGSAFACGDLIISFPGGTKRTYFRVGQEKYSLQQGGAEFPIFLRTYFIDDPLYSCPHEADVCRVFSLQTLENVVSEKKLY